MDRWTNKRQVVTHTSKNEPLPTLDVKDSCLHGPSVIETVSTQFLDSQCGQKWDFLEVIHTQCLPGLLIKGQWYNFSLFSPLLTLDQRPVMDTGCVIDSQIESVLKVCVYNTAYGHTFKAALIYDSTTSSKFIVHFLLVSYTYSLINFIKGQLT